MRTALHRDTLETLDAAGYEAEYGKPVDDKGRERVRPLALCDICRQDVFLRAEHSKLRTPNFVHFEDGAPCPIKAFNAQAYRALNPGQGNPDDAQRLRDGFFATWRYHWQEFDRIIGYASVFDFVSVLKYADGHGIWRYRGMGVQDVLPVLLTLMDFPPLPKAKRHLRDYGLRFFYVGTVANTNDYWNLPAHERSLLKVVYDFPGQSRTFQSERISDKCTVAFEPDYQAARFDLNVANQPTAHPVVISIMAKEFGV
ncbi:hypothetical protein [Pseudomonas aeruginosa]|nr:hypothetical protein [Pseudomonas aeruginosa]MCS8135136.1 hypothetical protein [Pseudomonas aeruginosa]MCS8177488.1 hypothetical protein [Pseudomonas aeruginosa]MCT0919411.1 hypothetical protein [Pseudomonas aeruginosa]RPW10774.1 hypothetical protein IPC775_15995 [Pseudomonas aeruginosa]RQI41005.1 hypothetical protein IPC24_17660 [Pseudomonas aeruginosa]